MTKDDIFLNFLYRLSTKKIKDKVSLEGGASLSFIYGVNRIFSNDLDFTIENKKLLKNFASVTKEIIKEIAPSNRYLYDITPNKIIIKDKKKIILQLDIYPLASRLFSWEKNSLNYNGRIFTIKTHSLKDIFAEKITNIFQENRSEFKDILDANRIFKKIKSSLSPKDFLKYLHNKFVGKKIKFKIKNNPHLSYLNKRSEFKKSYIKFNTFKHLEFTEEFESFQEVIKKYL